MDRMCTVPVWGAQTVARTDCFTLCGNPVSLERGGVGGRVKSPGPLEATFTRGSQATALLGHAHTGMASTAAPAEATTEETQNTYSPLSRDLSTSDFEFGERDLCFAAPALLLRTPWVCNVHWINRKAAVGHDNKQPIKVTPQIRSNKARATASLQRQAHEHPEL